MNEQIIVRCKYRDYELVRAWALPTVLILQRGEWAVVGSSLRQFQVHETTRINFAENPEIAGIYDSDNNAWSLDKLYALLHTYCEELDA